MNQRPNSPAARDVAYHLHPYTDARKHEEQGPMVISGGSGASVTDEEGRSYIEAMAGLWCAALGFDEERLAQVAYEQMRTLPYYHTFAHKVPLPVTELAERLISMAPGDMGKAFFANSGSEANDTALKIVWYYNNARGRPEKKKIISRQKAYHGVTIATASLTGLPANHRDFDLPIARILHTGCPHHYRFAEAGESEEDFATRRAEELEQMILEEGPETVAAFIGEPVMGAGGVIVPPKTYWEKIQRVLRKHDVLLIADEVICGFGRTGNMFGSETFDIRPDMVSVAKALSSAYLPISAVMMTDEIYQTVADNSHKIGVFGHGFTYSGHPVSAAVANEALKIYEERDILSRVRALTPRLQDGLRSLADHPLVGEVRGLGMIAGVELVADKATKAPFDPLGKVGGYCYARAQEHGIIVRNVMDTLAICPPFVIREREIDAIVQALGRALDDTLAWARDQGLTSA